ncbi:chemotaxis MotD protein [Liberibacter crescens BT-1]|uniref:Chemotaxis MotD protein n=1 Tax=Liberibacter crescens (strain BT-1) TaxID=1215343 RepID=L0EX38_LIBCB|nr:flagellar hook-length control protein FliK [Liberibacter crescens]AGA64941.1 chemotaxis MotD protein [Liberibacter crescens BT-1]AMC12962.1 hypothetical protein RL73_04780 [Liberibacter crescens]
MTNTICKNHIAEESFSSPRSGERLQSFKDRKQHDFEFFLKKLPEEIKTIGNISDLNSSGSKAFSIETSDETSVDKIQETVLDSEETDSEFENEFFSMLQVQPMKSEFFNIGLSEESKESLTESSSDTSCQKALKHKNKSFFTDSLEKDKDDDLLHFLFNKEKKEGDKEQLKKETLFLEKPFFPKFQVKKDSVKLNQEYRKYTSFELQAYNQTGVSLQNNHAIKKDILEDTFPLSTKTALLGSNIFCGTNTYNCMTIFKNIVEDVSWRTAMQLNYSIIGFQGTHKNTINTLKFEMCPKSLGNVTATLSLVGNNLVITLGVENNQLYKQLYFERKNILDTLKLQGYIVDYLDVNLIIENSVNNSETQMDSDSPLQHFQQSEDLSGNKKQNNKIWNKKNTSAYCVIGKDENQDVDNLSGIVDMNIGYVYI